MSIMRLSASVALFCLPLAAQAADISPNDYVDQSFAAWQGFYIGAHTGFNRSVAVDSSVPPIETILNGGNVGGHIGYNEQVSNHLLLGLEFEANLFELEAVSSQNTTISSNWNVGGSARLGYTFDWFMAYAKLGGGIQNGHIDNNAGKADSNNHFYWMAGLGVEAFVTNNLSLRLEYLHSEAGPETYVLNSNYQGSFKTDTIRLATSYHF